MSTLKIETNHGQAAHKISNHYHGDVARYRAMDKSALQEERERLLRKRRATYRAFVRHRTVPWFLGSMAAFSVFMLATWGKALTPATMAALFGSVALVAASTVWMARRRRPLFDGLQLIKADLKIVEAFLAIKDAESAYEVS